MTEPCPGRAVKIACMGSDAVGSEAGMRPNDSCSTRMTTSCARVLWAVKLNRSSVAVYSRSSHLR